MGVHRRYLSSPIVAVTLQFELLVCSGVKEISHLLGDQIRTIRRRRGLSLERLAELSHLSTTYVGEVERGSKEPSISTLLKLAEALSTSLSEILAPVEKKPGPKVGKHELLARIEGVMQEFYTPEEARTFVANVKNFTRKQDYLGHSLVAENPSGKGPGEEE